MAKCGLPPLGQAAMGAAQTSWEMIHAARALRLDNGAGGQKIRRNVARRHRLYRKLRLPRPCRCAVRSHGPVPARPRLSVCAGGDCGFGAWRHRRLAAGYFAYDAVAKPVLEFYGKLDKFENLRSSVSFEMIVLLLVTSGLSHLPPIKVVTILSGVAGVNLWLFVISAILARGARFFFSPGSCAATARQSRSSSKKDWG